MRLIDADDLKNELSDKDYITYTHEYGDAIPVDWIMSAIDNAPTVKTFTLEDIEEQYRKGLEKGLSEWETERPQGEWIYIGQRNRLKVVECTNCHKRQYGSMKYCGNCGAYMRKEAENDTP